MIPLTLHIKNFLSYGPQQQTIDFGSHPLICLSGKNGHGKSALLDAITWAIWGQARKIREAVKADEGLLRLGQTQMLVTLDFMFNGQRYRVRREFAKQPGKFVASLDFGVFVTAAAQTAFAEDGGVAGPGQALVPLTDKTIRATQEKIEATLGLDYESFVNSAFLKQGQSNEFSQKSSKERKEILASILGLHKYEQLRRLALDKIKRAGDEQDQLAALRDRLNGILAQKEAYLIQVHTIEERQRTLADEQVTLDSQRHLLQQKKDEWQKQHQAAEMIRFQLQTLRQEEAALLVRLNDLRTKWKEVHRASLNVGNFEQLQNQRQQIQAQLAVMQETLQKQLACKEQLLTHKEQEQRIRNQLQQAYNSLVEERKLIDQLAALTKRHEELWKLLEGSAKLEAQFEKRKTYYQKYVALGNMVTAELAALQQKQKLVHDDTNPSCPLCEQNLSASRKRFLKSSFAENERAMLHRRKRLTVLMARLKELLIGQHEVIKKLQGYGQEQSLLGQQIDDLKIKIHNIEDNHIATRILRQAQDERALPLLSFEAWIAQQQTHIEAARNITTSNDLLAQLTYNPILQQELTAKLIQLEQQINSQQQLLAALPMQAERKGHIHTIITEIKRVKNELSKLQQSAIAEEHLKTLAASLIQAEQQLTAQQNQTNQAKEAVAHEKGRLEQQKLLLINTEQEIKTVDTQIKKADQQIGEYQAIAGALSKDGIQALLIEEAIPEIEQEANRLLAKLTNNQAQLFIESVRDLKKGGTKETLDINISDALGIRPYELFSGGEAFRIDFALRVAISKLLARRAGTSLQTLIIDEGFGSQDEEGLSHIMDALHKIQDDFAKVIIVSHLPTMKDQFPVHFMIEKGAQGSMVSVMQHE